MGYNRLMAFIRKVITKSGATAVQIAHKRIGKIIKLEHIGSAHNKKELDILLQMAKERLFKGQISLFPACDRNSLAVELKSSYSRLLWLELQKQYRLLGFHKLRDDIFMALCLARLVEPCSKLDSLRVLSDLGVHGIDKNQLYRCLARIVEKDYRRTVSRLCFKQTSVLSLLLYDVTTLYFETQKEDDYRKPGLSKERRLEPQIVIGLLVDRQGFPLAVQSFEGNTAETKTILPVLQSFADQHHLDNVTVVADAAMMSQTNLRLLADSGYTYIVGSRLNKIPYAIAEYQKQKQGNFTDEEIVIDQHDNYRVIYQYREKRAKLDLKNIEKQVAKAKRIVSGKAPVHRSKFVTIKGSQKTVNQNLIDKAYNLAGIKGYVTNLNAPNQEVISAYHQLFQVEASFRMAKSDLKARPIFHRKRDSIEAHLTVVFTALAIGRRIEAKSGVSIKQFIKTLLPVRAGTVIINGKKYMAKESIPPAADKLLKTLHSGH
jgi:transposase